MYIHACVSHLHVNMNTYMYITQMKNIKLKKERVGDVCYYPITLSILTVMAC